VSAELQPIWARCFLAHYALLSSLAIQRAPHAASFCGACLEKIGKEADLEFVYMGNVPGDPHDNS
jgi:hypothetical protein